MCVELKGTTFHFLDYTDSGPDHPKVLRHITFPLYEKHSISLLFLVIVMATAIAFELKNALGLIHVLFFRCFSFVSTIEFVLYL